MRHAAPALLAFVAILLPLQTAAQSVEDLLQRAQARQSERLEGIDDVTIVQDLMGMPHIVYLETERVDGSLTLQPQFTIVAGFRMEMEDVEGAGLWLQGDLHRPEYADRLQLEGEGEVDGEPTHVLVIDDFTGLEEWAGLAPDQSELTPRRAVIDLEQERLVPRRIVLDGEMIQDGEQTPFRATVRMSDYREVEGLLLPYLTEVETDVRGMGLDPDEVEELRSALEEFERQLEQVPEAQREMMEQMIGPRMDEMVRMLEEGAPRMVLEVGEVRINEGPPEDDGGAPNGG